MNNVYTCAGYQFENEVLTIYQPKHIGMVSDVESFNTYLSNSMKQYDAIVCPSLFTDENGNKPKIVVFKPNNNEEKLAIIKANIKHLVDYYNDNNMMDMIPDYVWGYILKIEENSK